MTLSVKKIKYYTPVVFWLFQLIIHIIRNIYLLRDHSFSYILKTIVVTYPLDIITFCIFYFFLAPKFFKKEKIVLYVSLGLLFFVLHSVIWTSVYYLRGTEANALAVIYVSSMGHNFLYAFYGISFRLIIDWFQKNEDSKELEKQQIKTELALLRSQINPHFLFNTLNNINSFAISDPDKTSFAIIRLSEIMRYMLYEAKGEKVLLEKEINYINNYLDLQKIRYKNNDFISFQVGDIPSNILVPPMLFIPFIENAFKHGKKSGEQKIRMNIDIQNSEIHFKCSNKKRALNETEKKSPKGIGIENIRRRLELIYPNSYNLQIMENESDFHVELKIKVL